MTKLLTAKKIGILGGGQLARMLCLKSHEMGLDVHVYSPLVTDPAAQVTHNWHQGKLSDFKKMASFVKAMDVITFESEFIDCQELHSITKRLKTMAYPRPLTMAKLRDRSLQKQSLIKNNLLTSPYFDLTSESSLFKAFDYFKKHALQPRKPIMVLKKRLFGYDGYGTFIVKDLTQLKKFIKHNPDFSKQFIAEQFIPFDRELALIVARNSKKQMAFFPLVESFQENAKCLWVKGPYQHKQLKALKLKISTYLNKINYVGVIAFELFDYKTQLFINEIAPRVHNSGHYSLDGLDEDQFTMHMKAILNMSLKEPRITAGGFAMYNLIGSHGKPPKWNLKNNIRLHWYGKSQNRVGRKMGHLNAVDASSKKALERLKSARKEFNL